MADDKSSSSSQTANQTGTSTTTPIVPSYLNTDYQSELNNLVGFGSNATSLTPEADSSLQTAANNDLLNVSGTGAANLSNAYQKAISLTDTTAPSYTAAQATSTGYAPTNASSAQISTSDIQRLLSPYLSSVVNSTLANYDKSNAASQAALAASAGGSAGAFGSSGYNLQAGELTADNALNRAQEQATLQNQGYDVALTGATSDAANQQSANLANAEAANQASAFGANAANTASLTNATADNTASQSNQSAQLQTYAQQLQSALGAGSLATAQNSTALADAQALGTAGQTQYAQDLAAQQYPVSLNEQILALMNGIPVSALSGSTTNQSGNSSESSNSNTFSVGTDLLPKNSIPLPG